MACTIRVPEFLADLTDGERLVTIDAASVDELIGRLDEQFPGMGPRLLDDSGLRRFVNIYVNGRDIRFASGLSTPLVAADEVVILHA